MSERATVVGPVRADALYLPKGRYLLWYSYW